jgi:GT2 family glycosyltransferase
MYNTTTGARDDHWGFYGVLIPRAAVEAAGVPNTELIFGFEDTEYLRDRIWLAGFPGVRAEQATVRVALRPDDVRRPGWKYYYQARNFVYVYLYRRRHIPASTRIKSLVYWLYGEVVRIVRIEDSRSKKVGYLVLGIFDGLLGRLGLRVKISRADRPWKLES